MLISPNPNHQENIPMGSGDGKTRDLVSTIPGAGWDFAQSRHPFHDIERPFGPGEKLKFAPGESVTLMPGDWHAFWGEGGDVLIGEVSTVNDDLTDNIFRDPIGRFAEIDEDVDATHLLVSDYDTWLQ